MLSKDLDCPFCRFDNKKIYPNWTIDDCTKCSIFKTYINVEAIMKYLEHKKEL